MKLSNSPECYLIGDDNLTLVCAQVLLKHKFSIKAVCSKHEPLTLWANKENIHVCSDYPVFEKILLKAESGFLFSILNKKILSSNLLSKKNLLFINYHNAILPRYAGLHATSWAILNGETEHGITWHQIAEQIDGGDILAQGKIQIDPNETAISLDMKCADLGLKLFKRLVPKLKKHLFSLTRQDLSNRTYFSKSAKPEGNALISWYRTAEEIERIFRACNLSDYTNDFSLPKIAVRKNFDFISAKKVEISHKKSNFQPGTIVEMDQETITITTLSNDLVFSDFFDSYGESLSMEVLEKEYSLDEESALPALSSETFKLLQSISQDCSSQEEHWVKKLTSARIPSTPLLSRIKPDAVPKYKQLLKFDVPEELIKKIQSVNLLSLSQITLTLILIYFHRINNYEAFDVGISNSDILIPRPLRNLFLNFSWLSCDFNPRDSYEVFSEKLCAELNKKEYKTNCLRDIFSRYPNKQQSHFLPNMVITRDISSINSISTALLILINDNQVSLYLNDQVKKMPEDQYYLIDSMERKILTLLQGISRDVKLSIYKLPLLAPPGLSLYVKTWSGYETKIPVGRHLIDLFEECVKKYPENTALIYKNVSINYRDLNSQSNNLAIKLSALGIKQGEYVGIASESGVESMVAMLAILKLDSSYVPIDPDYPVNYIAQVLIDLRLKFVLSSEFISDRFKLLLREHVPHINFYSFSYTGEKVFCDNLNLKYVNDVAYVMLTSGSTGKPKGVAVTQQGIIRLVINNGFLEFKPEYKIAQASNLCFDASTFEIWGALLNGGALVCIDKGVVLDPLKFKDVLIKNKVNVLWVTSSLLDRHVENDPTLFNSVDYLLAGGDVVNPNTVKKIFHNSGRKPKLIINGYGPTENTTFSTTYAIHRSHKFAESIPIGSPIANTQVYVVDKYLQPVCIGIPGELILSGMGLAQQYICNDEANKNSFIETSVVTGKKQRFYKTGDNVKWLSDGNLAYLGRKDSEVKLRGFRIDLNTIKTVLLKYQGVSQCHVNFINKDRLYVYISSQDKSFSKKNVLDYLKENLPYYMIPSEIFVVNSFPLNKNGKIDIASVESLCQKATEISRKGLLHSTSSVELAVLRIWRSILSIENISPNDNFFDLGGNSLIVSTLICRIYKKFKYRLSISDFLEDPTVSALSNLISGGERSRDVVNSLSNDLNYNPAVENASCDLVIKKEKFGSAVLVTGASGFLGSHLVNELSRSTYKKIYCLVRAPSNAEARLKLKQSFENLGISLSVLELVEVIHGDLTKDKLGLGDQEYLNLVSEVDQIYNTAAEVNHLYSYEQLRVSNIVSVKNLLAMLNLNKAVQLNHISTISACYEHIDSKGDILETFIDTDSIPKSRKDGYSLTKWVSEKILCQMYKKGFKIKIFRPAWILGDVKNGIMPLANSHIILLLKACIQLGYAPNWDARINIIPVDELAKTIIHSTGSNKSIFNVINKDAIPWDKLIKVVKYFGYTIKVIEASVWSNILMRIDKSNALFPLMPIYTNEESADWILKQDLISDAHNDNYLESIQAIGNMTVPNYFLLAKYLSRADSFLRDYRQSEGFLASG